MRALSRIIPFAVLALSWALSASPAWATRIMTSAPGATWTIQLADPMERDAFMSVMVCTTRLLPGNHYTVDYTFHELRTPADHVTVEGGVTLDLRARNVRKDWVVLKCSETGSPRTWATPAGRGTCWINKTYI